MDQELRDLVEQMRQLIPVLQGMSKTPGSTGNQSAENMTRGLDRMVVALGQLAVKLDTTKKTRRDEEEAVKKFAKAVEKTANNIDEENKERKAATDALEAEIKAREEATRKSKLSREAQEQEDKDRALKKTKDEAAQRNQDTKLNIEKNRRSSSSSRELFDSLSSTGGSAEILKNKFLDLGGDSMVAQSGLQLFSAGLSGTAKSLTTFASGLINGQRGAELSAKAVSDFANPVLNAAGAIGTLLTLLSFIPGPIGFMSRGARIAGAAVFGLGAAAGKAALSLNELAAKQIDAQFKSFNALSQSGIRLQDGFTGVIDTMQTLGMTMSEVEQFNQLIGENNRSLAIMGGTATKGAKQFSEVAGQLVKGELGKQLEYMGVTQEEQRKATLSYMSIQARTGQLELNNTNKLIESSANFIKELDLAAQMTGTTRKDQMEAREAAMAETRFRAAMTMAIKEGNVAEINRLKRAEEVAGMMRKTLGEQAFVGALQLAAGRGALTTEAATELEVSTGFTNLLEDTSLTAQQMYQQIVKNGVMQADSLAAFNQLGGDIKGFQIASVSLRDEEARIAQLQKAAADQGFTGVNAIELFTEFVKKNQDKVSKETRDLINANRAQQAATMTMERGLSEFNVAVGIHKAASETFANAVKMFGDAVGLKVPGGTPTFGGVPVESGVRLPPTPEAAQARVEQADATVKDLGEKIKEQEKKLKDAKTNVEKDTADAEIKKLKKEKDDADRAKNAAELGKRSVENRKRLEDAHNRTKAGVGPATATPPAAPGSAAPGGAPATAAPGSAAPGSAPATAAKPAAPGGAPATAAKPAAPGSTPNNPAPLPPMPAGATPTPPPVSTSPGSGGLPQLPPMPPGANPATAAKPAASLIKILDLIGRAESRGNYNVLVGGKTNPDLTNMTIAEVQDFQSTMVRAGHESTAVGKYQIIQETLRTLLNRGVVSPNEKFSPATQDKLGVALLHRGGWARFQSGNISADQMADAIARIWAGFPLANGMSYYQGVGTNKATISRQEVLNALTDVPKAKDGGMFRGPMSGYPAVLHGQEAVIPLKNGAVPVMMPALDELVSSNRAVDAQVQVLRNEMGSMMRELTNALVAMKESGSQERMIQLLESMSRSQQTTATASQKMAQLASN
jgi:muramidase (phage lysozyme)